MSKVTPDRRVSKRDRRSVLAELAETSARALQLTAELAALDAEPEDERLTLDRAAARAECSVRTLRDAIRDDEVPAARTGRRATVLASDVDAWVARRGWRPTRRAGKPDNPNELYEAALGGGR